MPDNEISDLVLEWSELLAEENYAGALALLPPVTDEWTPEILRSTIEGYGVPDLDAETLLFCQQEHGVARFVVKGLRVGVDLEPTKSIHVDRKNLYGLDPAEYLGMVHYGDVPPNSGPSDLTARFCIKRLGSDCLMLEFLDIHVM
jgi:hypothetical protein